METATNVDRLRHDREHSRFIDPQRMDSFVRSLHLPGPEEYTIPVSLAPQRRPVNDLPRSPFLFRGNSYPRKGGYYTSRHPDVAGRFATESSVSSPTTNNLFVLRRKGLGGFEGPSDFYEPNSVLSTKGHEALRDLINNKIQKPGSSQPLGSTTFETMIPELRPEPIAHYKTRYVRTPDYQPNIGLTYVSGALPEKVFRDFPKKELPKTPERAKEVQEEDASYINYLLDKVKQMQH